MDSAGNVFDTEETTKAIMADNAAKAALCPTKLSLWRSADYV